MLFSYESLKYKMQELTKNKVKYCLVGTYRDNIIKYLILALIIYEIGCNYIKPPIEIFLIGYSVITAIYCVWVSTRKMSLAITDKGYLYQKFTHFGYKPKEAFEFKKEDITYIDYHKILFINYLRISVFDKYNRFHQLKLYYGNGKSSGAFRKMKDDIKVITNEFIEMQKVLDRGDF